MSIKPKDFLSDTPPERIIGTECEYNIQRGFDDDEPIELSKYIGSRAKLAANIRHQGEYLDIGARCYQDGSQIEYDTAEELGPLDAAAADLAGPYVVKAIVGGSGLAHRGIYRISGSSFSNSQGVLQSHTSGYHENYLLPRSATDFGVIDRILPSFLATRLYSMGGMVMDSFVYSQKVWGIGGAPIARSLKRLTTHGSKPMAIIPPAEYDDDVIGSSEWARVEVRFADPGSSPRGRMLTFGATSLLLRMVEHPQYLSQNVLDYSELLYPVTAAQVFAQDLTMRETQPTHAHKKVTLLDVSEVLSEAAMRLTAVVDLPDDEVIAAHLWQDFNAQMRAANPSEHDYGELIKQYDFAARHNYLSRGHNPEEINRNNPEVVQLHLYWDRVDSQGGGMQWWDAFADPYVTPELITGACYESPPTRACIRDDIINNKIPDCVVNNWSTITDKRTGRTMKLKDSYQTELRLSRDA